ncbi:hypothetical protein KUTeg_015625 [Tegillarca granosa]|uniref:Uncharacterized protein n=1 Tax=Tegillarca granosa TaxID=220873 RepID=A0ABQ9EUB0_TEGGR|nr:hypothetical protein KUTeg_015625 [Tegillarca granosa]
MFSLSGLQPQILTAVSEIASLINLPRVCVSMPTRKQHTNTEKQVHSQVHEENTTSEDFQSHRSKYQTNTVYQALVYGIQSYTDSYRLQYSIYSPSTSKNEDVLKHTSNEDFVKNETASHTSNAKATTMLSQVEIEKIILEESDKDWDKNLKLIQRWCIIGGTTRNRQDFISKSCCRFNQSKGVIIIGATNRLEDIDKAVLRPGRFDVQVKVHIPDLKERVDILELYLGKVVASKSIDVLSIARGTPSFTGADLESLVNKAALRAAFLGDTAITMEHIEFAKDNILMGPAKKNKIDNVKSLQNTAIHEGGHTVVAYYTKHADPLNKVTIIPRGQALGFVGVRYYQEGNKGTQSKVDKEIDKLLQVCVND